MSKLLAAGHIFGAQDYLNDPLPAQGYLDQARIQHGHALCLCSTPHRQMVIREVNRVLYLAVWPNDGHHHDPCCEFYREPNGAEATQKESVPGQLQKPPSKSVLTPAARLNADGIWDINVDAPRDRSKPVQIEPTGRQAPPESLGVGVSTSRDSFSLQQFLTWLWDATSMARWGSGWRRDWWRVSRAIRTEAGAISIRGKRLNDILYIPPPFRKDRETEIHSEYMAFVQPLIDAAAQGQVRRGFLLCEIKAVDRTEYGYKFQARNMARPVFMDEHLHAQVAKQAPLSLAMLPRRKELKCSVVALLLVESTEKGNLRAINASLMLTSEKYVPVSTKYELELANQLCETDRTFTRGGGRHLGADFVLRDTVPATAMVIYSLLTPDYVRQRDRIVDECEKNGCAIWKWEPAAAQALPPVPRPRMAAS